MTSTTDRTGHPDVAEISDLAEGLLPPSRGSAVRRHLDACELCADVYASLEEIRGLLGTLPGPPRMPDDVAHRIDAALAAEALLNTKNTEGRESTEEPLDSSGARPEDESVARVSRETSTPAGRPAGHPRASTTGPGRKGRTRSGRRRIAVLGTVFTVAALGLGSVLLASLGDDQPSHDTAGERATAPADTFSEGKLQQQVAGLLAEEKSEKTEGGGNSRTPFGAATAPDGNRTKVFQEPVVPGCVRDGIGRDDAALAVEDGRYQGKKALLVLLPAASDPTRVTAYIVDATCVDHRASSTSGKILLERTYPSV
ncbi:anti-sigma factor family protein [Streptomyces sp. NPDC017943]|uniref:anti-sigma factor family protein n=1 Tax=Streptomyces sp. NPDC017943 TaxID=3365019 RepID=UPI00379697EE